MPLPVPSVKTTSRLPRAEQARRCSYTSSMSTVLRSIQVRCHLQARYRSLCVLLPVAWPAPARIIEAWV
ncbi:hypothetical protein C8R44DRAFT_778884 [Mycena epipterygia]|nr:hypothetical protein C8R44DRAFT_778884 [Mycena epipterygia]